MGIFLTTIGVASIDAVDRRTTLRSVVVDDGPAYSWIPVSVLAELVDGGPNSAAAAA